MPLLPADFVPPALAVTPRFRVRPITIHDVVKDFDAVMSSREHLWARFGDAWGWPRAEMTLEQDLIDLAWHQKEGQLRSSFVYAVMSLDEARLLGCIYIDPPTDPGSHAEVAWWARASELPSGLDAELGAFVRGWLDERWPFDSVRFPFSRQEAP